MNGLIPLYFQKNLNKQISKLISFIGKSILASGLQKHAIYAPAFKYCLINEQECFIGFKTTRRSRVVLDPIKHDLRVY